MERPGKRMAKGVIAPNKEYDTERVSGGFQLAGTLRCVCSGMQLKITKNEKLRCLLVFAGGPSFERRALLLKRLAIVC